MSVYLFTGKDEYRQQERLKSLLKEMNISKDRTVYFDGDDAKHFNFNNVLLQLGTYSLFEDTERKAVIIRKPFFLKSTASSKSAGSKKKKTETKDGIAELLEHYLKSRDEHSVLILYCSGYDADTRKKEYKLLEKHHAVILKFDQMKPWEFEKYASDQLKKEGFHLSGNAWKTLMDRVGSDTMLLARAMEKLRIYGEKELSENDISHLVSLNPEVNTFSMANRFISGDLNGTMKALNEMLRVSMDYSDIIPMLSSQIRFFWQIRRLHEKGYGEKQIALRLHANEYRVRKSLESCDMTDSAKILKCLNELAELDQGIKNGTKDAKNGLETFLLRNI